MKSEGECQCQPYPPGLPEMPRSEWLWQERAQCGMSSEGGEVEPQSNDSEGREKAPKAWVGGLGSPWSRVIHLPRNQ